MSMRLVSFFLLACLSCVAQTAGSLSESGTRDDLRAIRASMEKLEKGQATLILLQRIQTAQMRLSSLEQQRIQLLGEERVLNLQLAAGRGAGPTSGDSELQVAVQTSEGGAVQTVPARDLNASAHNADAESQLREVRQLRAANEQEIKSLSNRIAAWEKKLEEPPH